MMENRGFLLTWPNNSFLNIHGKKPLENGFSSKIPFRNQADCFIDFTMFFFPVNLTFAEKTPSATLANENKWLASLFDLSLTIKHTWLWHANKMCLCLKSEMRNGCCSLVIAADPYPLRSASAADSVINIITMIACAGRLPALTFYSVNLFSPVTAAAKVLLFLRFECNRANKWICDLATDICHSRASMGDW